MLERGQLFEGVVALARLRCVLAHLTFGEVVATELLVEPRERERHARLFRPLLAQGREAVSGLDGRVRHARLRAEELRARVERRVNQPLDLVRRVRPRLGPVAGRVGLTRADGETHGGRRDDQHEQYPSRRFQS